MLGHSHQLHEDNAHGVSSTSCSETLMPARLNDADRRAVDALLEGDGAATLPGQSGISELQFQQRMSAARRWLELLGAMPAEEPSASLMAATLARIEQTPATTPPAATT